MRRFLCLAALAVVASCAGGNGGTNTSAGAGVSFTGAGSTFVNPFFSKAFYTYNQRHPNVAINYQSIGSGGGIEQFSKKTVDFGATDVPMNATELAKAGGDVVQIPVALGGEAIAYNVPGQSAPLRLSGAVLAQIFLGKITDWSDPAITALNPKAHLSKLPIVVAHRSDGSGTTYIFTDFLSSVSPQWKSAVGTAKSVQWPAQNSIGGKGNEGVAGILRGTPGAIGYVELAYAQENHMPAALIQNKSGAWLAPNSSTIAAAAAAKANVSASNFSIVNQSGAQAYPIVGYSWALLSAKQSDANRAKTLTDIFKWIVGPDAQAIAGGLGYVPLPRNIQRLAQTSLARIGP